MVRKHHQAMNFLRSETCLVSVSFPAPSLMHSSRGYSTLSSRGMHRQMALTSSVCGCGIGMELSSSGGQCGRLAILTAELSSKRTDSPRQ